MKRASFVMQSVLALRALAVIIVMLTAATARAEKVEVKYIDENGVEQTANATVLTGSEDENLAGGWYVCNTPASENDGKGLCYTHKLDFSGDTHLILADGCKMTIESDWANVIPCAGTLTIYGQNEGTGSLIVKQVTQSNNYSNCLYAGSDLIINGGQITVIGGVDGVYALNNVVINGGTIKDENCQACIDNSSGNIIINGGTVETNSSLYGLYANNNDIIINGGTVIAHAKSCGIYCRKDVIINGGKVEAEARSESGSVRGICAKVNHNITLGWTNATDYIKSFGYDIFGDGVVKIPAGKGFFVDGTTTIVGGTSGTDFSISDIVEKKLTPTEAIPTDGNKYIAFSVSDRNRKITDVHAQVYAVTGYNLTAGMVYLKPVAGNVVPKGMPVVIGHVTDGTDLPRFLAIADDDAFTDDALAAVKDGLLKGFVACDGSKTVQDYLDGAFGEGVSESDYIPYLLTGGSFKAVLVSADDVIRQDICLLFIPKWDVLTGKSVGSNGSANSRGIGIGDGGATGLTPIPSPTGEGSGAWYDMQGRRIDKPARKGVYIRNGKKVAIK